MTQFSGKVVVITGAGSGLGRASALLFAQKGAIVVVSDINHEGGLATVSQIEDNGGKATFIPCNVAKEEEVNALIDQTISLHGRLDCAVNNAGVGGIISPTHQYPLSNFEKVMAINTTGVFLCMKAELEVMLKQGFGSIVNVASVAGLAGLANSVAYTASKHAVVGMTRATAMEYARKGIRVNAVCPAFTITQMVENMFEIIGDAKDKLQATIPMKRFGQAHEVAEAIVWMSSDQNSFMTGSAIPIDGGMTAF
jgi:NAD(P)-dependent dehydrogenase (short-subunit alcohol dehydrogenase family)